MCSSDLAQAGGRVENSAKALEQTKALADTLAADKDGKFANSKFLQFVSKMSRGEIILEGNEVSSCPHPCICFVLVFVFVFANRRPDVMAWHLNTLQTCFLCWGITKQNCCNNSAICETCSRTTSTYNWSLRRAAGDLLHTRLMCDAAWCTAGEGNTRGERSMGKGV